MTISTKMAVVPSFASHSRLVGRVGLLPQLGLVGLLGVCACLREEITPEAEPGKADSPAADAPKKGEPAPPPSVDATPSSLGAGLDTALERAVVPPGAGGSNYRVDPFVAALAFAAAEREAERWFTAYVGTPAKVDYEVRGFAITGVGERAGLLRLGLREGDIVESVNGVPASDAATIRRALAGSDSGVTVGVFREDYSFVLGYRFESGLAWMRTREEAGIDTAAGELVAVADEGTSSAPGDPGADVDPPRGASASSPSSSAASSSASSTGSSARPGTGSSKPSTPSSGSSSSGKGSSSTGTSSTGTPAGSVSCTSDAACTIRKSYFDSMVSSPSKLESQAKIVPAIQNDVFSGYKLSWIRPGSAIDQMGFRAGDKITHVNGRDLTDDAQAFALYLSLSSTRSYKIKYLRGGQSRTKSVEVK